MVIQFRSFLIAAILCICVPMAPSLSGQEGPGPNGPRRGGPDRNGPDRNGPGRNDQKGPQRKGPDQKGPQRNGPQRNGGGPGFRGFGFPGADFRGSDMRRPMGPGFGRPDSKATKSRGNTGGSQRPAPHRPGPKDFGPRYSKQSNGGGKDPRGDRGTPRFSSMNRGFMHGGMPRSNFGKRGSGNRSFGKRGMQHRGVSRGRFQGGKSRFSYARHGRSMQRFSGRQSLGSFQAMHKRGMQHRGMQHRGMHHRGMQHRGMQHRGMQHRGMHHRGMQHRGMQHRGMMSFGSQAFGKGPSRSAPKMPRMGNGPRGMNRHSTGRSSGFEGRGSDRFDSKPDHGRGIHSGANRSRGDDRVSDRVRGPAGMNRPVDHDQRMEQMKQFFGGQGGNRGPTGPDRGPRSKEGSDNKSDRNNRSNMRPDFPQRGPGMDRSFGPPRITNRGGDLPASRGFDRRDIKPDRPSARASRSDSRPSRDDDRAPERKPAEKNRTVEVEINGDTGTITLKGSAEDVKRFQQLLDRANLKGKTEVKGKSEQTKGETSNSRRRPSRASDKKTSKEVAPSKTSPESELWNFV